MGVKNFEMEASLLFTLAQLRGIRAGAICAVFANRKQGAFVDSNTKLNAEVRSGKVFIYLLIYLYISSPKIKGLLHPLWSRSCQGASQNGSGKGPSKALASITWLVRGGGMYVVCGWFLFRLIKNNVFHPFFFNPLECNVLQHTRQ